MVLIAERPPEAKDRAIPGHWEGDLIFGHANRSQVGILTERTTRYTILFPLADKRAETVTKALALVVRGLPSHLLRSLAWDQGKEMSKHVWFTVETGVQVYFCDPGHPWQRGTAENTVGLIRQYLPKGANLTDTDAAALESIAKELNQRPRKTLGWDSPAEVYARVLASQ
jgi:IS30 family transposase